MRYFKVLGWFVEEGNTHFDLALYQGFAEDQEHIGDVRLVLEGVREYSGEDWEELNQILKQNQLLNEGVSLDGWEVPIDTTEPSRKELPDKYETHIEVFE